MKIQRYKVVDLNGLCESPDGDLITYEAHLLAIENERVKFRAFLDGLETTLKRSRLRFSAVKMLQANAAFKIGLN